MSNLSYGPAEFPAEVLDPDRLAALADYEILDTTSEPEFDDIVQLAQKICNTPVALLSLVDANRQWFKARVEFAVCETPIEQSVCAHALREDDLLVITDLTADKRTRNNTLVTGAPYMRFYAGAVLKSPKGHAIGTLCVVDTKTRPEGLSGEQADGLRALARQTMVVMGMRFAVQERAEALVRERAVRLETAAQAREFLVDRERLREDELRHRLAQEAGGIGTFEIDLVSDRCFVSARFCRIYGLPLIQECDIARAEDLVLNEDRHLLSNREGRLEESAARENEFRIARESDGAIRWVNRRTEVLAGEGGHVRRMFGVVQDVTERKLMERRASALNKLGDALREVESVRDVVSLTGRVLGTTLTATRAGFGMINVASEVMTVEDDWSASVDHIAGSYPLSKFARTIARLRKGGPVVVANIPAAAWMEDDRVWFDNIASNATIAVPLLEQGQLVGIVYAHSATPRTWSAEEVDFVQAVADRAYAVIARIEAEGQQRILNLELSHRLKNTLSMVQAIARQTLRDVEDKTAVRAFENRVIALSRAHDVLLQESWSRARIEAVVSNILELYGNAGRITASGPEVTLGSKATLSMSLLLNELATNAAKHGALSCPEGRVMLTWTVDKDEKRSTLVMVWRETGGPPVLAPSGRRGFGSKLISMGLVGTGAAKLDYTELGLVAEFSAPMSVIEEGL